MSRCPVACFQELTLCKCLNFEYLVVDLEKLITSKGCGPLMLRLSWHHKCIFYAGEKPHGIPWLEAARGFLKAISQKYVPRLISHADLAALAANTAIKALGGPEIPTRFGRLDIRSEDDVMLPDGEKDAKYIRDVLGPKGLEEKAMVAVLGANVCGMCHVEGADFGARRFDNSYFKDLLTKQWEQETSQNGTPQFRCGDAVMMSTDMALVNDPNFKVHVQQYAADEKLWLDEFTKAWVQLQEHITSEWRDIL